MSRLDELMEHARAGVLTADERVESYGLMLAELAQMVADMHHNEVAIVTPRRPTLQEFEEHAERLWAAYHELMAAKETLLEFMQTHRDDERQLMDVIADASEAERRVVLDAIDRLGGWSIPELDDEEGGLNP